MFDKFERNIWNNKIFYLIVAINIFLLILIVIKYTYIFGFDENKKYMNRISTSELNFLSKHYENKMDSKEAHNKAYNQLFFKNKVYNVLEKYDYRITDYEVMNVLKNIKDFQTNGLFDYNKYKSIVKDLKSEIIIKNRIKKDLYLMFFNNIKNNTRITDSEVEMYYKKHNIIDENNDNTLIIQELQKEKKEFIENYLKRKIELEYKKNEKK